MALHWKTRTGWASLLGLALAACSGPMDMDGGMDGTASDGAAQDARDARVDTGVRPDVRTPDVMSQPDVISMDDVVDTDAMSMDDVAAPDAMDTDASMGMDAAVGMDASIDSGVIVDSGIVVDTGVVIDTGVVVDSGVIIDSGVIVDSGVVVDSGIASACDMPRMGLSLPMSSVMVTTTAMPNVAALAPSCSVGAPNNSEAAYTLNVTSRTGLVINTDMNANDPVVALRRVCTDRTAMSELLCDDDGNGADRNAYLRGIVEPGTYSVYVDSFSAGTFRLNVRSFTPAANADCAMPATLPMAGVMNVSTANGGASRGACVDNTGGQLFYAVTIPANSRLVLATTRVGMQDVITRVLDSCAANVCVANQATTSGAATNITVDNATASTRTVIVSVASTSQATDATFNLVPTVSALAPNATCAGATMLTVGAGSTGGNTTNAGAAAMCAAGENPELYYSVTVPANSRADVNLVQTAGQAVRARVLDSCTTASCAVAATTMMMGANTSVPVINTTAMSRTVVIAVSSTVAGSPGQFTIQHRGNSALAANATCASAQVLGAGSTATASTAGGGATPTTCRPTDGPQLFYSVTIPPTSRGTLTLTRMGGQDVAMRVLATCTAMTCDSSTATAGAAPVTLNVDTGAMARTVIVAVASSSQATAANFQLGFNTTLLPYTVATLSGQSCDMGVTTAVAGVNADDSHSMVAALPFSFRYFSMMANATHFSASANGFVQLYPNAMGTPFNGGVSAANATLPAAGAGAPNGVVAAFWDDLFPVDAMTNVTTAVLGMMGSRRFVVQWNNWTHFDMASRSVRLTFQTRFYEGTGVIEHVYCAMNAGMDTVNIANGASATIGIEAMDGVNAVQSSFDTAMAVAPGTMFRYTPN